MREIVHAAPVSNVIAEVRGKIATIYWLVYYAAGRFYAIDDEVVTVALTY